MLKASSSRQSAVKTPSKAGARCYSKHITRHLQSPPGWGGILLQGENQGMQQPRLVSVSFPRLDPAVKLATSRFMCYARRTLDRGLHCPVKSRSPWSNLIANVRSKISGERDKPARSFLRSRIILEAPRHIHGNKTNQIRKNVQPRNLFSVHRCFKVADLPLTWMVVFRS